MNDRLTVAPEVLRNSATEMKSKVDAINAILNQATAEINKVPDNYQGTAAESFVAKYNTLKTKYDNFCKEIEEYIAFLNNTANRYEETDKEIAKKSEEFLA